MNRLVEAWHRHRRENRFLLGVFVSLLVLSTGAFFLLQRAQAASPRELANRILLFVLWYLDLSLILILLFVLIRNLVHLAIERRMGVLGSRFRTKLVLTYVGLSLLPVVFIFLVATNLLQRSIDRWFSAPVEEVLRGGAAVAEQVRSLVEQHLERQAAAAAEELAGNGDRELDQLQSLLGVDLLAVYDRGRLVQAVTDPRRIPSSTPPLAPSLLRVPGHRADRWRGGLLVRAWRPIPGRPRRVVVVGDMLPRDLLQHLERATAAHATFQEMQLERGTITWTTILVFLAITLLLLFGTVWIGLYLSRRFTEPLLAVASATQRVAEGNELEEIAVPATDEVAVLVDSFNAMVRRVRSTEAEILASNQELATLLATVPTGVLTVDPAAGRFRANPSAARLLGLEEGDRWTPLDTLAAPGLGPLRTLLEDPDRLAGRREIDLETDGALRHVEVSARRLPGGGWVVAVDDLTQLVRAQRQAAWSEVARRIAHEIKNPLTPIRLAAERILRQTTGVDGKARTVIETGCAAIIAHVSGLKELVDAFHQYARMPQVNPRPTRIDTLLREVAALYVGVRDGLQIELAWDAGERTAFVDPALLRQALVNLLDNAVEAMDGPGTIVLRGEVADGDLTIEVLDEGVGLPTEDTGKLTQPFFSTKGRGSGMGLALVHRIVSDHGGSLELRPRPGGGTVARIVLPGVVPRGEGGV